MIPAAAASTTPRSEVSSHGCTTTVVAGCTCLARAIKRSYFVCGGSAAGPIAARCPISLSLLSMVSLRKLRSLPKGGLPGFIDAEQLAHAFEALGGLPADLTARCEH